MSVFSVNCQFYNETQPLVDATHGWDVVYAVKYSYLNNSIDDAKPWLDIAQDGTAGSIYYSDTDEETRGLITGLSIVTGGSGSTLRFQLALGELHRTTYVMGAWVNQIATGIRAQITVSPSFARGAEDGLMALTVSLPADPTVSALEADISTIPMADLRACIEAFLEMSEIRELFTMELAHVLTRDVAESGHIPWLQPTAFRFATADMPNGTDGILAILGSISGDMSGLAAEVNPLAMPIDDDIGAAIIVHSRTLTTQTFCEQLNTQLGAGVLGETLYIPEDGTLANAGPISAYYQQDEDGHFVLTLPQDLADSAAGAHYPATIPTGALRMTVASNSIDVSLSPVRVAMGAYTLVITMSSSFQIVADEDENLNLVMIDAPDVSYTVDGKVQENPSFLATTAAVVAGFAMGECIPFALNRGLQLLSPRRASKVNELTASVISAERHMEVHNLKAVRIKLSYRSELVIGTEELLEADSKTLRAGIPKMTKEELSSLRLPRQMPELHAADRPGARMTVPATDPVDAPSGDPGRMARQAGDTRKIRRHPPEKTDNPNDLAPKVSKIWGDLAPRILKRRQASPATGNEGPLNKTQGPDLLARDASTESVREPTGAGDRSTKPAMPFAVEMIKRAKAAVNQTESLTQSAVDPNESHVNPPQELNESGVALIEPNGPHAQNSTAPQNLPANPPPIAAETSALTLLYAVIRDHFDTKNSRKALASTIKANANGAFTASDLKKILEGKLEWADFHTIVNALEIEQQNKIYEGIVKLVENSMINETISHRQYKEIIISCHDILDHPEKKEWINQEKYLYSRVDKTTTKLSRKSLYLRNSIKLNDYANNKYANLDNNWMATTIKNIDRSVWSRGAGIILYVAGAAASYFIMDKFNERLQGIVTPKANTTKGLTDNLANKGNLLFRSVSFPLLTRASDDGPLPTSTLRCAAINGGLVLGIGVEYVA